MKPRIDFFATLKSEMLTKKSIASRLRKNWGTTVIDGIEVYNNQMTVWPISSSRRVEVKKALKLFGMSITDIDEQDKTGISRLYLKLNPDKGSGSEALSREALATIAEREIPFGESRSINVNFTSDLSLETIEAMSDEELLLYLKQVVDVNAINLYSEIVGDDIPDDTFGKYILLDDGTDFEVTISGTSIVPLKVPVTTDYGTSYKYITSISVELSYVRIGYLNDDSPIIQAMVAEESKDSIASLLEAQNSAGYNEYGWIPDIDKSKTDAIWYKGYLRTDVVKNLRNVDFASVVFGSVDIGYDKKKTKWWKKALTIVIAIVVTVATWGTLGPVMAISLGALTLSIGAMILASMGEYDGAEYVGRWAKVAGIIAMIAGITAMLQSLSTKAATTAVTQSTAGTFTGTVTGVTVGTTTTTVTTAAGQILNISTTSYMSALSAEVFSSVGSMSLSNLLSVGMKVVEFVNGNIEKGRVSEIREETAAVKESAEQVADAYDKNLHIAAEHIKNVY